MANIEFNTVHQGDDYPIAPEEWTIISQPEVNNNVTAPESSKHVVKDINDYFEVVGDVERKCNLCSREMRLNAEKNSWPLKRHFKSKHQAEWNKLLPFMKKYKSKKMSSAIGNGFELVASDETQIVENDYFDNDIENIDPDTFEEAESVPMKLEMADVGNFSVHGDTSHARPTGVKRAKFAGDIVQETMARVDCGVTKDQYSVFGDFITNELREMGAAQFRRAKLAIQKCLLDLAEEKA